MTAVWIAAAVVAGISGAFAGVLLVAEKLLVNYGQCTIDVNGGGKTFQVKGGNTLLGSLKDQGIFLPSACGGRGTCAYCKCKVLDGGGAVAPTELPLLTEAEVADNVRISCQVKVRNDVKIAIPEAMLSIKQFRGTVERIRDLTHDMKELRIKLVEPEAVEFTAGQYVQLDCPPYGDNKDYVFRAYSIASPPSETGAIELIVRLVPGGICTTWVFTVLKKGDEVTFTGPFGDFGLSQADREMVWIAGGSGMAPFWCLLRHMKEHRIARKTTYFFGALKQRDLFFLDELRQLDKELDWFTFVPALSDPEVDTQWEGETGLITEIVGRHVAEGSRAEGYLCGSGGMIDAAVKVLKAKGIAEDKIFYDKFT